MLLDAENRYNPIPVSPATGQAITVTAVSTDHINHTGNRDIDRNTAPRIRVQVGTTFVGGTSIQAIVQTATDSAFTSPIVIETGPVVPVAQAIAGAILLDTDFPPNALQFTRMNYVVVGTMTAGTVNAFIALDTPNSRQYPDAIDRF